MYGSAQACYLTFCKSINRPPVPASEQALTLFIADLSQRLCYSSIRTYLAAVRFLHVSKGLEDPTKSVRLELMLRAVRKKRPTAGRVRLPITPLILRELRREWNRNSSSYDNVMLWAACCLGFFAFLRTAEFTTPSMEEFDPSWHLTAQDIAVDNPAKPSMLRVHIKASKTDQQRAGTFLYLGATGDELCPVAAVLQYLAIRGMAPGPLFKLQSGHPLSRQKLVELVRTTLRQAGLDCSQYAGHSFRIGAATTAAARGLSEPLIQTLGRWSSDSYQRYIKIPRAELAQVSRTLISSIPPTVISD